MARQQFPIGITILMFFCCLAYGRTPTKRFESATNSLKLLHVVFRHGDRTQDGTYPKDPHKNNTFYPIGVGHLTNPGKLREYRIGTYLRKTYDHFLTDTYYPGILAANASSYPRCRASMELVLAGLYPPSHIEKWNEDLNWQPIPFDYTPKPDDVLFWPSVACPKFSTYLEEYRNSAEFQKLYEPYADVLDYLQEHSGYDSKINIALNLYSTLKSQQEWPVELPSWANKVWPEPISEITRLDWEQYYPTEETQILGAGFLMSKIVADTQAKLDGDPSLEDTKIYLYGGHDTNIVAILSWLGTIDLHIPQYGSFIVFEIHTILDIPFIRIIHQNYESEEPQVIEIPECGFYCPLTVFESLYSQYLKPEALCN